MAHDQGRADLGLLQLGGVEGFDAAVVERVVKLVRNSEWKRQQAASGPKLARRAFGRDRRCPIVNGFADRA